MRTTDQCPDTHDSVNSCNIVDSSYPHIKSCVSSDDYMSSDHHHSIDDKYAIKREEQYVSSMQDHDNGKATICVPAQSTNSENGHHNNIGKVEMDYKIGKIHNNGN